MAQLFARIFMVPTIIKLALRSLNFYLTSAQRRQAWFQFGLLLLSSVLDVFGLAALVPVLLVASEPGGVEHSRFFAPIFHALPFHSERSFLVAVVIAMLVFFLLKNILSVWINDMQARFTARVGYDIICEQIKKYLDFPFWHFQNYGSAKLINSTLQVPTTYVNLVLRPLFVFFSEVVIVLVILVSILIYKPGLLLVLGLVLVPAALITYRTLRQRAQAVGEEINRLQPLSYGTVQDLFTGFAELKLAGRQKAFSDRLLQVQRSMQDLAAESYLHSLLPIRIIEMVAVLGVLTIFMYSLYSSTSGGGLIALVGLFAAAAYRLMPSVNRILTSLVQMRGAEYAIDNLESFRDPKYQEGTPIKQYPLHFTESLRIENLSYTFPSETGNAEPALNGINFTIRRGEKIGFIGASGSGKTTLMNVLLRFYREQAGNVLVDGQILTPNYLQAWYELVGYVKQDTFLMDASLRDNITLGLPTDEVDAERLHYAIEQASLTQFVNSLPEGVGTMIGERGSKLSGGQRQRIGIARALYKRAEILLLDEATSALDNDTEREVNAAITQLAHTDITILIIAHRLTTLRECDRIYELSNGRIVAERQYAELVH